MIKAWKNITKNQKLMIIATMVILIIIRLLFYTTSSSDYRIFLSPWFDHILTKGGLNSLLTLKADYNLPYQYAMLLMTKVPVSSLYSIKTFSVVFDFVLAYFVFKIIQELTNKDYLSLTGGLVALALPTIIMNSAGWGQSDSIFTAFLVATIYFVLKDKPGWAMLMYTISFSFKIQAIFLGPLLLVLLLKGFFKPKHFVIPVVYYVALSVPILMVGGKITRIIDIAMVQINIRNGFSFFLPNFYALFNADQVLNYLALKNVFLIIFFGLMLVMSYACYQKINIHNQWDILVWAFIFSLMVPYFLVRMHERYYFPAEYFALILLFINPKQYRWMFLILLISSTMAYLTVQWWGLNDYSYSIASTITTYIYPFLSFGIFLTFISTMYKEFKEPSICSIEHTK